MKRIGSLLLAVLMVCSCVVVTPRNVHALADESNLTISVDKTTVEVGDDVVVTVCLKGQPELAVLTGGIRFGVDAFECIDIISSEEEPDACIQYSRGADNWTDFYGVMSIPEEANQYGTVGIGFTISGTGDKTIRMKGSSLIKATFRAKRSGNARFTLYEDSATYPAGGQYAFKGTGNIVRVAIGPKPDHVLVKTDAVPATCTTAGNSEYWTCSDCGKIFSDEAGTIEITLADAVVPANGHVPANAVIENRIEATPNSNGGYDRVIRCAECGEIISSEHIVTYYGVHGNSNLAIEVDKDTVNVGDTVTVSLRLIGQPELTSLNGGIRFDNSAFRCIKIADADGDNDSAYIKYYAGDESLILNAWALSSLTDANTNGTVGLSFIISSIGNLKLEAADESGTIIVATFQALKEGIADFSSYEDSSTYPAGGQYAFKGTGNVVNVAIQPPHDHVWGTPVYEWSEDYGFVTATITCQNDNTHVIEEIVPTIKTIIEATCESEGRETYTATFTKEQFTTQTYVKDPAPPALGHDLIHHDAKPATCTEVGWEAYDTCSRCDYTTYVELPALGHDWGDPIYAWTDDNQACIGMCTCKRDAAHSLTERAAITSAITLEPTCTEDGERTYTAVFENSTFTTQTRKESVEKVGHNLVHHEAKAATCTEIGWDAYDTCSRCDYTTYVEIAAKGHQLIAISEADPTCTTDGNVEYWKCTECGMSFANGSGTVEIPENSWVLPSLGHDLVHHNAKSPSCTEVGWYAYDTCSRCDHTTYIEIPARGHDTVHHDAKAATCTEIGWNAYDTCSRCDYTTYAEIPALGHDTVHHDAKAATCTEVGWDAYDTCNRCDYTTYVEIAALGHKAGASIRENQTPATCTRAGGYDEVVYCSVCHEELSRNRKTIQPAGHSWKFSEWQWAEDSKSALAVFTCSICGEQKIIAAAVDEDSNGYTAKATGPDGKEYTDVKEAQPDFVLGDVTGDKLVTADDLTRLSRHIAKIDEFEEQWQFSAADVTGDDTVTADDLTRLSRYIAKIISSFDEQ